MMDWLSLALGLTILLLAGDSLVKGAVNLALRLGIPALIVSLTIVAFGTSLPELATAVTSALRREDDIAIGNIIGSNMFNMLGVIGIAAVIKPISVPPMVLARDFPIMFLLTGLLYLIASDFRGPGRMGSPSGLAFLVIFAGYQLMVWFCSGAISAVAAG